MKRNPKKKKKKDPIVKKFRSKIDSFCSGLDQKKKGRKREETMKQKKRKKKYRNECKMKRTIFNQILRQKKILKIKTKKKKTNSSAILDWAQ